MELYILSKQDLSILSICKLADYQINLDEETNAKSTFTLMKTNGLKKENYMVLNGLYRQFIFVIDDVQTEKESDVVTVTALDISNVFNRKVIEKNIDTMKSKSIEEFLANTISENFVNSDDTALNVNYIEIYWHTNTQGNVATNAENGLYNFHTFLINCRQYKNIYTDFKLENLGNPQTVEGKRISVEARNRKIVDISLHGETSQATRSGKNLFDLKTYLSDRNVSYTENEDGSLTFNSSSAGKLYTQPLVFSDTNKIVSLSGIITEGTAVNARIQLLNESNAIVGEIKPSVLKRENLSANKLRFNWGTAGTITMKNIQLEEGTTATEYEQYGASPSPDYPSPIENVEGRNKFNKTVNYIQLYMDINSIITSTNDYIGYIKCKPNTKYSISKPKTYAQSFYIGSTNVFPSNNVNVINGVFSSSPTKYENYITPANAEYLVFRIGPEGNGITLKEMLDNIQVEEGTVATPYVPYNSLEFKVEGKNKLKGLSTPLTDSDYWYNVNKNYFEPLEDGWGKFSYDNSEGTSTVFINAQMKLQKINLKPNTQYTFITEFRNSTISENASAFFTVTSGNPTDVWQATKTVGYSYINQGEIVKLTATTKEDFTGITTGLATYLRLGAGTSGTVEARISVIEGDYDTTDFEYEPYKSQVVTFPLGEEKLMEGSYLAEDGVHNLNRQYIFTGDETFIEGTGGTDYFKVYTQVVLNLKKTGVSNIRCSHFKTGNIAFGGEKNTVSGNEVNGNLYFCIDNTIVNSIAEMQEYLTEQYANGTPVIIEYELAEPETVPYTAEQQEAWDKIKNLTLFEGLNHISSNANMVLKYYPLEPVGLKFVLRIDIENKQETTELIDTTLPEVADYNKIYEEDVTAKVQVYIREDGSEYNLYLKTDRTTTTNKDDPDRASGKIEVISVETADRAEEEALNVMKGNNYKHLVEFKIAKTSKLMDITELHIGRPIRIKTDDDIYDSYISAITLSDENFVYFKSGSLRITLLDKLKASNNSVGNKLDVTGGKITGNLNILDNAYFGKNGVAFGAPYDEDKGGPLQLDGARIIESGSNSNGSYIKWSDGTMICTKSVIVSTKIENPWGNLFESSQLDLGNFPVSFIETPVLSVNKTIGRGSWLELVEGTTNSAIGNTYLVSAVSTTSTINITINIIAIGKWK